MKKSILSLFLTLIALTLLNSCVSFSSHQTAEVLKENETEWGEGFGYIKFDYDYTYEDENGQEKTKHNSFSVPYFPETIFRFGIAENMDAGIKLAGVIANIEGDIKYQLLQLGNQASNFTLSVQPSISAIVLGPLSMQKYGLAVLASERINSMLVFYGNIKYNFLNVNVDESEANNDDEDVSDAFSDRHYYSITMGVSVEGKKFWLRPEATVLLNSKFKKTLIVPAFGFGLKF